MTLFLLTWLWALALAAATVTLAYIAIRCVAAGVGWLQWRKRLRAFETELAGVRAGNVASIERLRSTLRKSDLRNGARMTEAIRALRQSRAYA